MKRLLRGLRHRAGRLRDRIVARQMSRAGFQPITATLATDIFVVGYPKSGNTWCQTMLCGLLYGALPSFTPDRLVQELVPDIHYKRYFKRLHDVQFFKAHSLPEPRLRRVIYLVRDGRDAMVSYYHHLCSLDGNSVDWTAMVDQGTGLFPCHWYEHVTAWLNNPFAAEMLFVKYEDLLVDRIAQLRRICEFARLDRPNHLLETIALGTSFAAMQRRERAFGWDNAQWPAERNFIRRGEAGKYAEEFPSDLLERFTARARRALEEFDYLRPADEQALCER